MRSHKVYSIASDDTLAALKDVALLHVALGKFRKFAIGMADRSGQILLNTNVQVRRRQIVLSPGLGNAGNFVRLLPPIVLLTTVNLCIPNSYHRR